MDPYILGNSHMVWASRHRQDIQRMKNDIKIIEEMKSSREIGGVDRMKVTIKADNNNWGIYDLTESDLQKLMQLANKLSGE